MEARIPKRSSEVIRVEMVFINIQKKLGRLLKAKSVSQSSPRLSL